MHLFLLQKLLKPVGELLPLAYASWKFVLPKFTGHVPPGPGGLARPSHTRPLTNVHNVQCMKYARNEITIQMTFLWLMLPQIFWKLSPADYR